MSKYSSLTMLAAYVVVSVYKIFLLVTEKSVHWFALSHAVEFAVIGMILVLVYQRIGTQAIGFSKAIAKRMFAKSKYYIIANLMVVVFQNTDHIMLKLISGDAENGFYTAAITCTAITGFVFGAIIDSMRPVILTSKKESEEAFGRNVSGLYAIIIYLALAQSVVFTIFANPIVKFLYGKAYSPAIAVLRVLVWYSAFSYMGTVRNVWILAEEKHNALWRINLCGVLANVVLNAFMIPVWGACGAAMASVLTQFFTNFVVGFLLKPIRPNNRLMLKGLNPKRIGDLIADMKKEA